MWGGGSAAKVLFVSLFLACCLPSWGWLAFSSQFSLKHCESGHSRGCSPQLKPGCIRSTVRNPGMHQLNARRQGMGSTLEERQLESIPTVKFNGIKVVLAGKPCSGKGTQAPLIARKYRCVHISTGDLLRAEVRVGSELGETAERYMKEGKLLPDDLIISMVKKRVNQDDCMYNGWILDGFPRTVGQARAMQDEGIDPDCVILLERPDAMVEEWCRGRAFDPTTGVIYHPSFNPAPPDVEPFLVRRVDDTPAVIAERLRQYHETFGEVVSVYEGLVSEVDSAQHELDVFDQVCAILDRFVPSKGFDVPPLRVGGARSMALQRFGEIAADKVSLLDIIKYCNAHRLDGYLPVTCGGHHIGFVGESLAAEMLLLPAHGVQFDCELDSCNPLTGEFQPGVLVLAPEAATAEERTEAVGVLIAQMEESGLLREQLQHPGSARSASDELYPIFCYQNPDFQAAPVLHMPQKALPFFGTPLYGIHVNGIVTGADGEESLWVSKRSASKLAYPGLLDQMVSHHQGSRRRGENVWQPDMSFLDNAVRAAQREASVGPNLLVGLRSASVVSYRYETAFGLETKVLFVYDLRLPEEWRPFNGDGEVDQFQLRNMRWVLRSFRSQPQAWKPNAMLVGIDFAVRRGAISPDDPDYLQIVSSLRVPPFPASYPFSRAEPP